jgi:hypothetical protein
LSHDESPLVRSLTWRKVGNCWQLFAGKRRFGKIVPDSKHPGMWRCPLSGGRLSDMANLTWARNAVMEAAIREIPSPTSGKYPLDFPAKRGCFSGCIVTH